LIHIELLLVLRSVDARSAKTGCWNPLPRNGRAMVYCEGRQKAYVQAAFCSFACWSLGFNVAAPVGVGYWEEHNGQHL